MSKLLLKLTLFLSLLLPLNLMAQWNDIKIPYGYNFRSSFIDQEGNIFLECYDDIYYSDDLGLNWVKTNLPDFHIVLGGLNSIYEVSGHRLLINESNSVYEFDKLTKTWKILVDPIYQLINIDHQGWIWYKNEDPNKTGVILTKDAGKTYQLIESNDPEIECTIAADSYNDEFNLLISNCGNTSRLYKFNGNGTFTFLNEVGSSQFLFINQLTGTIFTINTFDNLCRSIDQGNTLVQINSPIFDNLSGYINMRQDENGDLLINDDQNIYVSKDDGVTWKIFYEYLYYPTYQRQYDPNSIRFANNSDTVVSLYSSCGEQGVNISINNGKSWKFKYDNLNQPSINKLFEDYAGNIYAFTCSDTTVLRSADNGKTWNKYVINAGSKFSPLDMAMSSNGEIYATSGQGVYKSIDGGVSYTTLNVPIPWFWNGPYFNIYVANNGYLYINDVHNGYTYQSKDDGKNWNITDFNNYLNYSRLQVADNGDIYGLQNVGLFMHFDAAKNKTEIYDINNEYEISLFEYTKKGIIYFEAYNFLTSETSLYLSKDQMKTYEKINMGSQNIRDIFSDGKGNIYIVTGTEILVSYDDAKNFILFSALPNSSCDYYLSKFQNLFAYKNYAPAIYKYFEKLSTGTLVQGTVFRDLNNDCSFDTTEEFIKLVQVDANGTYNFKGYSGDEGKYELYLLEGIYDLSVINSNPLLKPCTYTGINVQANQNDTINLDLGLQIIDYCPYLGVEMTIPFLRRCFDNNIYVRYCNDGTLDATNANLKITLNDNLEYVSSTWPLSSQNNQELLFDLGNIPLGYCNDFVIVIKPDCDASIGDLNCINSEISPANVCNISLPNVSVIEKCAEITGSVDPNDKTALIKGIPANGKTEMNQDIEYVIRFQNTGNDTAFRVIVTDNIPIGYDMSTLKPINSSHPYHIEIENQRNIKFIFDPIALPDSNINEPASHGFIAFKISPNKDLPYGTKLDNYADIYFDFNAAVTTNTAYLTVAKTTNTNTLNNNLEFSYYPNPTKGEININLTDFKSQVYTLEITDVLGKELIRESWKGSSYNVNLPSSIKPGIYFIHVEDELGKKGHGKFVAE